MSLLLDRFPALAARFQRKTKKGLRPDIQGLRAFAVVAVILDHLLGWPKGGFVGVDIFFVISGFVITASLLREYERNGRISFLNFYKRRIKRIMPAAVLVLAATLLFSYWALNASRFTSTLWDGLAAFLFSANWRFAAVGTDYFQADGPASPLQHYWSLAVEEQYYFVWPAVMALVLALFAKRAAARVVTGVAIGLIALASFAWAMYETTSNPSMAYFSTLSRGWELAAGAGLAIAAPLFTTIPAALRPVLAWAGILGMTASLFLIDAAAGFPAPAAMLPVLATALVIVAGTGASEHRGLAVLTNPVSRYLGDISYSLYLWHWPIFILLGAIVGTEWASNPLAALAVTLVISVFAYHLVEDPIRKSSWLERKDSPTKRRAPEFSRAYQFTAMGLLVCATAAVVAAALMPTPRPTSSAVVTAPTLAKTGEKEKSPLGPETTKLAASLTASLALQEWPDTKPALDEVISSHRQAPEDIYACGHMSLSKTSDCIFGEGPKTAVIVGDSMSMTWANPVREALGKGWSVEVLGAFGCPFTSVQIKVPSADVQEECPGHNDAVVQRLKDSQPDLLFISNHYADRNAATDNKALSAYEWSAAVRANVDRSELTATKVVLLAPPPYDKDLAVCYTPKSTPADCVSSPPSRWREAITEDRAVAKRLRGLVVDSEPLFCVEDLCPAVSSGIATKSDAMHMTVEYGRALVPALREQLKAQGGL